MHIGNAYAALAAWLGVRSRGGKLILRIEDIDGTRSRPEHVQTVLRAMHGVTTEGTSTRVFAGTQPASMWARATRR